MYHSLAVDVSILQHIMALCNQEDGWFDTFYIQDNNKKISEKIIEDKYVYICSDKTTQDSSFVVIKLSGSGYFYGIGKEDRLSIFSRLIHLSMGIYDSNVMIPTSWGPYRYKNLISVFSSSTSIGRRRRIIAEINALETSHAYICDFGSFEETGYLEKYKPEYDVFMDAILRLDEAIKSQPVIRINKQDVVDQIDLDDGFAKRIAQSSTVKYWYDRILTPKQIEFVDRPLDGPVRLRGDAGSGKTLSMIIKAMQSIYESVDSNRRIKVLFLTHSLVSAETVRQIISSIDDRDILFNDSVKESIRITTLQSLASELLELNRMNICTLSDDGYEGKKMQIEIIGTIIKDYMENNHPRDKYTCSSEFIDMLESPPGSTSNKRLVWNLLNEFSCVFSGNRITESAYIRMSRQKWMMHLETVGEKKIVYQLYQIFIDILLEMKTMGLFVVINDLLGYLMSSRWDMARSYLGYNIVFIDEFHLFNQQERMVFQYLTNSNKPPHNVIVATDPKQSPIESFLEIDSEENNTPDRLNVGKSYPIILKDVFRFTKEIHSVIMSLDAAWVGLSLNEEMGCIGSALSSKTGEKPVYHVHSDQGSQFDYVCEKAREIINYRRNENGKRVVRDVAVLTLDSARFEEYTLNRRWRDLFRVVQSRDDVHGIANITKKIILSQPEYVAGLQFDTVFVIDVNKSFDSYSINNEFLEKRRFVSNLYLGISRAERFLSIHSTINAGGISDLLRNAIEHKIIEPSRL